MGAHSVVQGDAQPMFELQPGPGWSAGLLAKHHHPVLQGGPGSQNGTCSLGPAWAVGWEVAVQICSLPELDTVPVVSRGAVTAPDYFPMKDDYHKGR